MKGETKLTNRRKRAAQAVTNAEEATEAAFLDMGAAELAWMISKVEYRYNEQEDCKRDLRRARNTFRKRLKEYHVAAKASERINAELDCKRERRRELAQRRLDRQMDGLSHSDLTGYHAGRFQRWDHDDDMGVSL